MIRAMAVASLFAAVVSFAPLTQAQYVSPYASPAIVGIAPPPVQPPQYNMNNLGNPAAVNRYPNQPDPVAFQMWQVARQVQLLQQQQQIQAQQQQQIQAQQPYGYRTPYAFAPGARSQYVTQSVAGALANAIMIYRQRQLAKKH